MQQPYAVERTLAVRAAITAAQLCEQVRKEQQHKVITKTDQSPVTIADFGAQATICRDLESTFPNDSIVAEESATELRTKELVESLHQVTHYVRTTIQNNNYDDDANNQQNITHNNITPTQVADWIDRGNSSGKNCDRFWTIDPIDGTKGFLRPNGQYAVALSLIEKGIVKVGVLACPAFVMVEEVTDKVGWLFVAVRGQGAFRIPLENYTNVSVGDVTTAPAAAAVETPIRVGGTNTTSSSSSSSSIITESNILRFVESVEADHGNQARQGQIAKAVGISPEHSLRMDSQAKYGAIATGSAALYLRLPSPDKPNRRENIWDHAAGVVIVEEAGGEVTDLHGKLLDFTTGNKLENNQGVVVSMGGALHDKVIQALRQQ